MCLEETGFEYFSVFFNSQDRVLEKPSLTSLYKLSPEFVLKRQEIDSNAYGVVSCVDDGPSCHAET